MKNFVAPQVALECVVRVSFELLDVLWHGLLRLLLGQLAVLDLVPVELKGGSVHTHHALPPLVAALSTVDARAASLCVVGFCVSPRHIFCVAVFLKSNYVGHVVLGIACWGLELRGLRYGPGDKRVDWKPFH